MTRLTWHALAALGTGAALALSLALRAQTPKAAHAPAGVPQLSPEQEKAAAVNYQQYCALCHGPDREGYANDHAPSLRSKSLLSTGFPYALYEATAYGRPGTPMAGYLDEVGGPLREMDIKMMVLWLTKAGGVSPQMMRLEHVAGDAGRGGRLYAEHCATCHGANGEGGTGTALGNPAMLAMSPDSFLRDAIALGRDGTAMPAWEGTLGTQQIDDVVAFLRSRASGWHSTSGPVAPPRVDALVLNPHGQAPRFAFKDGHYIVAAELDRILREKRRFVLLDTRVPSVWQMGHIAGAAPVPYYSSRESLVDALPRDGTWIVAYCECPRAAADTLYAKLKEAGFENLAVLWEGIGGWVSLGYPIVAGTTAAGPDS